MLNFHTMVWISYWQNRRYLVFTMCVCVCVCVCVCIYIYIYLLQAENFWSFPK